MAGLEGPMLPFAVFVVGIAAWLISLPGFVLAITNRTMNRRWVAMSLGCAGCGSVLLFTASLFLPTMVGLLVSVLMGMTVWVAAEIRLTSSARRRPLTTLLTEIRLRLLARRPQRRDRIVASMTHCDFDDRSWRVITLPSVRTDWAKSVLDDAEHDAALDQIVGERELCIMWLLTCELPTAWLPMSAATSRLVAEVRLTHYANRVIYLWSGSRMVLPDYGRYSSTAVELAAVCRIATNPTVLYAAAEATSAGRESRTG